MAAVSVARFRYLYQTNSTIHCVGSMKPGRAYLIYAEGDAQVQLDPDLSIEEFAKKHSGNYFVITAQLH